MLPLAALNSTCSPRDEHAVVDRVVALAKEEHSTLNDQLTLNQMHHGRARSDK